LNAEGFDDFERQAAEIVAAAKRLLKELERLAGESIHQQRIAASEARVEGVKVTGLLAELGRDASELVTRQRTLLTRIEKDWQLHIDENAQRAGQRQAQEFGESISSGLRQPIAQLTADLQRAAERFTWTSSLKWGVGIALGIGMTIALGVFALVSSVDGLSTLQVRMAMSQLAPCSVGQRQHVCMAVEVPTRVGTGPKGLAMVVVRGM
jgi:hypothetical protein